MVGKLESSEKELNKLYERLKKCPASATKDDLVKKMEEHWDMNTALYERCRVPYMVLQHDL